MASAEQPILQRWTHRSEGTARSFIIPDGCRDLIHWSVPGKSSWWTLSHLQDGVAVADIPRGAVLVGYRLVPGAELPQGILAELGRCPLHDPDQAIARVVGAVRCDRRAMEALAAVAGLSRSVEAAAADLGVSRRTLERVLLRHTGRAPVFWSQLARARAAARLLVTGTRPVDAAFESGYSDQAHMTRSVQRWFGLPPREIPKHPNLAVQLSSPGYDAETGEQISTRYPSGSLT